MPHPIIDADECIGCGICVDACPQETLEVPGGIAEVVNEDSCIGHHRDRRRVAALPYRSRLRSTHTFEAASVTEAASCFTR